MESIKVAHITNYDFVNSFGQRVVVVDCPGYTHTIAIEDTNICACGFRLY
jgi:hypothetical protein